MKQLSIGIISLLLLIGQTLQAGRMKDWEILQAYSNVTQVQRMGQRIYALASGAIYSVDQLYGNTEYYTKQSGLNGANITYIAHNKQENTLLIFYEDGLIDRMDENQNLTAMTDLLQKEMNTQKKVNSVTMDREYAYCAMEFGIMVINLKKHEIADTYYIGENGTEVSVRDITLDTDSIYAVADGLIYSASRKDNLLDYNYWKHSSPLTDSMEVTQVATSEDCLYALCGGVLYVRDKEWKKASEWVEPIQKICKSTHLYALTQTGIWRLKDHQWSEQKLSYPISDVIESTNGLWFAAGNKGIANQTSSGVDYYLPNGPIVNKPYRMRLMNGKLYVVPGARWAVDSGTEGVVMIYDGENWENITWEGAKELTPRDFMNVAVDPILPSHFFVTSYGRGVFEYGGNQLFRGYTYYDSPLHSAVTGVSKDCYVRTDGAIFDDENNLWIINTSAKAYNIHVVSPEQRARIRSGAVATWDTLNIYIKNELGEKERLVINTPQEIFIDTRNRQWKWIPLGREDAGMLLLDDHGTPANGGDDESYFRSEFKDQDGNTVRLEAVYCATQDLDGDIWIGTSEGVVTLPHDEDFRTSNICKRVKIARNDGTNLADYLLHTEQVNAIAVDGGNRKWFGTEGNGVFFMSEDGTETLAHFTTENSPLLSDKILSIAIDQTKGIVYVGTEAGLMAYQSDAAEAKEDYTNAYVYPNPVRPDFTGMITIAGLMENSIVHILDSGGNLVCETRSNGSIAIWDGKTGTGKRVATGVYSIFCNTEDGAHSVLKLLVTH